MIDAKELAKLLSEEFKAGNWGWINPDWLQETYDPEWQDEDGSIISDEAQALLDVLERACKKLKV